MRAIFLDVDGVLNTYFTKEKIPGLTYNGIDPARVEMLKALVDQSSEEEETIIVLSSSWRVGVDRFGNQIPGHYSYLRECLAAQGLRIFDETPSFQGYKRGAEIRAWIKQNWELGITGIVVLDDKAWADFKETQISRYWVRTSWYKPNGGLQSGNVKQALKLLKQEIPESFK